MFARVGPTRVWLSQRAPETVRSTNSHAHISRSLARGVTSAAPASLQCYARRWPTESVQCDLGRSGPSFNAPK
jgi:hypothetical protein